MATPAPSPAPRNPALLVLVPIGIVLIVIASFAAYFLWPRGKRVGSVDLLAAEPSLEVVLEAGDTLSFRLDARVGTERGYPDSSRSRTNAVDDQLGESVITITLAREGGPAASTQCRAYDGKVTTGSSSSTDVTRSGLPLRCKLKAHESGTHTLAVRAEWTPQDMRKAKLEVRRQRAD